MSPTVSGMNWRQVLLEIGQDCFELVLPLQAFVRASTSASRCSPKPGRPVQAFIHGAGCGFHQLWLPCRPGPVDKDVWAAHTCAGENPALWVDMCVHGCCAEGRGACQLPQEMVENALVEPRC